MKAKKILLIAAAIVSIATVFASCNTKGNYKELIARRWVLEKIEHSDSTGNIAIPQNVYIEFSDSSMVYGRAECNNFFSRYNAENDGAMSVANAGSTMMWCPNMPFEDAYLKLIREISQYRATSSQLKLMGPDNKYTLYYIPNKEQE